MTTGRETRTHRHTLLVTRTGANEYTLYKMFYSDIFRNNSYTPGLCSNAFASANAAFALAFDCPVSVMDAFALAFDSPAFALVFDSNAFDWNQMHQSNAFNEIKVP